MIGHEIAARSENSLQHVCAKRDPNGPQYTDIHGYFVTLAMARIREKGRKECREWLEARQLQLFTTIIDKCRSELTLPHIAVVTRIAGTT